MSHTPGHWRVAPASLYAGSGINVDAGTAGFIALCGERGDEVAQANAALIAAAPELLSNLKFAVALLSAMPVIAGTAQVDAMRAAIKKATGETE